MACCAGPARKSDTVCVMDEAASQPIDLPDEVAALKAIIGAKAAVIGEKELRIAVLEEQLRLATHKRFGASSEKADPDQLGLFNEAEALSTAPEADAHAKITVPEHTRKRSGRKPLANNLPRVRRAAAYPRRATLAAAHPDRAVGQTRADCRRA
jgi:hypothetical protein